MSQPHPRCMGPLCAPWRWKAPQWSGKPHGNKRILSLALTHWSNLKDSCCSLGCPKSSDLFRLSVSILSTPLGTDLWKYQKEMEEATKVVPRRGDALNWGPSLVLFTLSSALLMLLPVQITGILERCREPTAEDALLSQISQLIRTNDFSAPTYLTRSGRVGA